MSRPALASSSAEPSERILRAGGVAARERLGSVTQRTLGPGAGLSCHALHRRQLRASRSRSARRHVIRSLGEPIGVLGACSRVALGVAVGCLTEPADVARQGRQGRGSLLVGRIESRARSASSSEPRRASCASRSSGRSRSSRLMRRSSSASSARGSSACGPRSAARRSARAARPALGGLALVARAGRADRLRVRQDEGRHQQRQRDRGDRAGRRGSRGRNARWSAAFKRAQRIAALKADEAGVGRVIALRSATLRLASAPSGAGSSRPASSGERIAISRADETRSRRPCSPSRASAVSASVGRRRTASKSKTTRPMIGMASATLHAQPSGANRAATARTSSRPRAIAATDPGRRRARSGAARAAVGTAPGRSGSRRGPDRASWRGRLACDGAGRDGNLDGWA